MDPTHDRPIGCHMLSKRNRQMRTRRTFTAGRAAGLLLLCALAAMTVSCTPMVQIQVTRGAPVTPTVWPADVALLPTDYATPATAKQDMAIAPAPEATVGVQKVSQVRLAAPVDVETTPLPTATVTLTPTPTPIPPATSPPDKLVIASIGIDAPVQVAGWVTDPATGDSFWETPANAAGFHQESALPGWAGNTVLSGHHNIEGKVFEHLHQIRPGDAITLYVDGIPYEYAVADNFIVQERDASEAQRQQNAAWIAPTDDERLTLVTCWPANDNSHRLIVVARPMRPARSDHAAVVSSAQRQTSTGHTMNQSHVE